MTMREELTDNVIKQLEENDLRIADQQNFEYQMLKREQEKQEELWKDKEIKPFGFNIMIKPTSENPYLRKVSETGIITDSGRAFKNPDSGQEDMLEQGVCYAKVLDVGPDTKHVKKGDEIIYLRSRILPLPFKGIGYCLINEGQVLGIINTEDNLKQRFDG